MRWLTPFVLFAACSTPEPFAIEEGSVAAQEPADALGPHDVGHRLLTMVDPDDDARELPVHVWYPATLASDDALAAYPLAGPITLPSTVAYDAPEATSDAFPLLVFSHGYDGIATQSVELVEWLASHGFVVASPEHVGNSQFEPATDFDDAAALRVADVSHLIDLMIAKNETADDPLQGTLDPDRIGVLGHSFGGMTSVGMAIGWAGNPADERVDAIFPISAVIRGDLQQDDRPSGNAGFTDATMATASIPVFLLGGTEDLSVPIENNAIAYKAMTGAPALYKADIEGANHTHFANICSIANRLMELGFDEDAWPTLGAEALIDPYRSTCSETAYPIDQAVFYSQVLATAFFRTHLNGEASYAPWMTAGYAEQHPSLTIDQRLADD